MRHVADTFDVVDVGGVAECVGTTWVSGEQFRGWFPASAMHWACKIREKKSARGPNGSRLMILLDFARFRGWCFLLAHSIQGGTGIICDMFHSLYTPSRSRKGFVVFIGDFWRAHTMRAEFIKLARPPKQNYYEIYRRRPIGAIVS